MFNNSEGRECRHLTIIQLVYLGLVLILCHDATFLTILVLETLKYTYMLVFV